MFLFIFTNALLISALESDLGSNSASFAIKDAGYHTYFGLASQALANDAEFEPKSDSKADIKRAFVKSLKNKKMNKKILGEFIELVA